MTSMDKQEKMDTQKGDLGTKASEDKVKSMGTMGSPKYGTSMGPTGNKGDMGAAKGLLEAQCKSGYHERKLSRS